MESSFGIEDDKTIVEMENELDSYLNKEIAGYFSTLEKKRSNIML